MTPAEHTPEAAGLSGRGGYTKYFDLAVCQLPSATPFCRASARSRANARRRRQMGRMINPTPIINNARVPGRSHMKDTPSVMLTARAKLSSSMPPRMNPMSRGASG